MSNRYSILCIYLLLALTTFAVFWQVHSFNFLSYDDDKYVTENSHVYTGLTWNNVSWTFTCTHYFMWHPVTSLSHMLDCEFFGLNPQWHHLVSLMSHIANALLLFAILKTMTSAFWPSAFVAAVFALHPLNVESVAWIAERKNVVSGFFWLLTIACYVRYVKRPCIGNYLFVVLVFCLALMSKPTTVTLPFVLLLLDYWPLNRLEKITLTDSSSRRTFFNLVCEKIPLFLLSAVCSGITFMAQQGGDVVVKFASLPLHLRLANAVLSYTKYIGKMIYPTHLAVFYPHPGYNLSLWQPAVSFLVLVVISIGSYCLRRTRPFLIVGWFWFLGTLVPVIGLIQAGGQAMADRYTYIPLIGLFIIIAWETRDLLANWKYRKIILRMLSFAVVAVFSICTWFQLGYWRNSRNLFEHAIKVTEGNYIAYTNLGAILITQDKFDDAVNMLRKAAELRPDFADAFKNLGIAYGRLGRTQEENEAYKQAMELYKQTIKSNPDLAAIHVRIGEILSAQNKLEEAADHLRKALAIEPLNPQACCLFGVVLGRQGKFDQAVEQFDRALKIKPDFAEAHNNIGFAFLRRHNIDQAVAHLTKAVQLNPESEKSQFNLAKALTEQGEIVQAVTYLNETLRLKPDWVEPMNILAWLLATQKDTPVYNPQKAVRIGKHACELTGGKDAGVLDTLAAAYAADGNFPDAVAVAQKALNLVKSGKNNQAADEIQKRLDLYKTGKPYAEIGQHKPLNN